MYTRKMLDSNSETNLLPQLFQYKNMKLPATTFEYFNNIIWTFFFIFCIFFFLSGCEIKLVFIFRHFYLGWVTIVYWFRRNNWIPIQIRFVWLLNFLKITIRRRIMRIIRSNWWLLCKTYYLLFIYMKHLRSWLVITNNFSDIRRILLKDHSADSDQ